MVKVYLRRQDRWLFMKELVFYGICDRSQGDVLTVRHERHGHAVVGKKEQQRPRFFLCTAVLDKKPVVFDRFDTEAKTVTRVVAGGRGLWSPEQCSHRRRDKRWVEQPLGESREVADRRDEPATT